MLATNNPGSLREDILQENLLFFWKKSEGGGVISETKLSEELFVVVCVWKLWMQGGGVKNVLGPCLPLHMVRIHFYYRVLLHLYRLPGRGGQETAIFSYLHYYIF